MKSHIMTASGSREIPRPFAVGDDAIRPANNNDIPVLLEIEAGAFDPKRYGGHLISARQFSYHTGKGNSLLIVDQKGGQVRGYALLLFRKDYPGLRFYSLATHPKFQGQGVGSALFAATEKIFLEMGLEYLDLEIREDNQTLLARYGKLGYRQIQRVADYYEPGVGALKMRASLKDIKARHSS